MDQVVIQVQTFALFQFEVQFPGLPVWYRLKTHARLHAVQYAHQATLNLLFGGNMARNLLFALRRRRHIPQYPTQFQRGSQRGFLQPPAHLQDVLTEVLEHHTPGISLYGTNTSTRTEYATERPGFNMTMPVLRSFQVELNGSARLNCGSKATTERSGGAYT